MGSDWEDDEWEAPTIATKDAPESWSDEEAHDEPKEAPAPIVREAKKPEKVKEKTLLEIKIEEREAREAAEKAQKAALRAEAGIAASSGADDDVDDKQRRRELEEAADFDNALDAFGGVAPPKPPPPAANKREPKLPSADGFVAKTDADFETLAKMMYAQLQPHEGKKGFNVALKAFIRAATANMSTDECKDLSTSVSVISNDKIKADREKDQKGKKKKVKGKINIAAGKDVDADFDDDHAHGGGGGRGWRDDDYDFM